MLSQLVKKLNFLVFNFQNYKLKNIFVTLKTKRTWVKLLNINDFNNYQKSNGRRKKYIAKIQSKIAFNLTTGFIYAFDELEEKRCKFYYKPSFNNNEPWFNFRENFSSELNGLNSRMRASLLCLKYLQNNKTPLDSKIYITEQITKLYKHIKKNNPNVIGSEYLSPDLKSGTIQNNIQHEDVTCLSFEDCKFDYILSFDVLEHVPNYIKALNEFLRCLKPEGWLMFTVPIILTNYENIVRAKIENNKIVHILEPEYHGDPLSDKGILCYYNYGWQLVEQIKEIGFKEAFVLTTWSIKHAILGENIAIICAKK